MKKILFLVLILIGFGQAQFGYNELNGHLVGEASADWDFDGTDGAWTMVNTTISGGYGKHDGVEVPEYFQTPQAFNKSATATFRVTFKIDNVSGTYYHMRSQSGAFTSSGAVRSASGTYFDDLVSAGTGGYLRCYSASNTVADIDWVFVREILDTLIVSKTGHDGNMDTVLTHDEAFNNRGAHSGGYFITNAGTYSESAVTIDSSFTKWETSGGCVNYSGDIDFNNVTCTVSGMFNFTGTLTNDGNVTYDLAVCPSTGQDKGFKEYKGKYKIFNNWK